ncbi:MAG: hypothetical protein P4M14_04665 [Gammaproteobacteria bacterium]|nr:hypothetical protein [Gammaproteobacteria bacterium]
MTYPNLIFINEVLDKYKDERVEKSSRSFTDILSNTAITLMGKANNLSDVRQKFNDISEMCSKANQMSNEVANANAWVDITIKLGEIAFLLETHHSHEILHLLRTYILLCATTWPTLNNAFIDKNKHFLAEKKKLRNAIIKAEKATGVSDDEEESAEEEEAKAEENIQKKSPDELRLERDKIDRSLIYIGNCDAIIEEKDLLKKLFPHLSSAGKIKKIKGFEVIPTIPLVLHQTYYLVYSKEYFGKHLEDVIADSQQSHDFKYGRKKPPFAQSYNPVSANASVTGASASVPLGQAASSASVPSTPQISGNVPSNVSASVVNTSASAPLGQAGSSISVPSTPRMPVNAETNRQQSSPAARTSSGSILAFIQRTPDVTPPSPLTLAQTVEQPPEMQRKATHASESGLEEFKQQVLPSASSVKSLVDDEVDPSSSATANPGAIDREAQELSSFPREVAPASARSGNTSPAPGLFNKPVTPPPVLDPERDLENDQTNENGNKEKKKKKKSNRR